MQIITLAAQKGGVGKTTLAVNLAVAAQAAGIKTALFDLDPQESATAWSERRKADLPHVEPISARRLAQAIEVHGAPVVRVHQREVEEFGALVDVRDAGADELQEFASEGDGHTAAVEFAGQGVTSPGYEAGVSADPKIVAASLVRANAELKWCDTSRRGYMALTITADRVTNDWIMLDTIKQRSLGVTIGHRATVMRGRNVMV